MISQEDPAFRHQNEEKRIDHPEQSRENEMRQGAEGEIVEHNSAVSQLVQRADQDQIPVLPEVASENQEVGNTNHQDKSTQEREIASKPRQLTGDAEPTECLSIEKSKDDPQHQVVDRGQ